MAIVQGVVFSKRMFTRPSRFLLAACEKGSWPGATSDAKTMDGVTLEWKQLHWDKDGILYKLQRILHELHDIGTVQVLYRYM